MSYAHVSLAESIIANVSKLTGMNVAKEVMAHPARDRGISSALMIRAYLRVPELTTPATNWKTKGRKWATILEPHKLSQTSRVLVKVGPKA